MSRIKTGSVRLLAFTLAAALLATAGQSMAQGAKDKFRVSQLKGSIHEYIPKVATANDFWGKNGLDVETINTTTGPAFISSIQSGSADGGITAYSLVLPTHEKGGKFMVAIAGDLGLASYGLMVSPKVADRFKGDWRDRVHQMKGLRMGVPALGGEVSHVFFGLLGAAGVKPDELTIVQAGTTATAAAALKRGDIDGFIGSSYSQQLALQDSGVGVAILDLNSAAPFKTWQQTAFFVSQEFAEKKPDVTRKVQAAVRDTQAWIKDPANFDRAMQLANEILPLTRDQFKDFLFRFQYEMKPEATDANIQFFVNAGVIKTPMPYSKLVWQGK